MSVSTSLLMPVDDVAAHLDVRVVRPTVREVFVDLDAPGSLVRFWAQLGVLAANMPELVGGVTVRPSSTRGHYHVVVTLTRDVESSAERLMLQACLGSDLKRELLGVVGMWKGKAEKDLSVFFEPRGGDS